MERISLESLFPLQAYGEHRKHTRAKGYCDPFVPYVGEKYGNGDLPRLVYSGVAAGWSAAQLADGQNQDVRAADHEERCAFIADGMHSSAFWRLFDAALAILDRNDAFSVDERRKRAAWTNLSKAGQAGETAPPDSDLELRQLDVTQFEREIAVLQPELILCPSGQRLEETGNAIFDNWPEADLTPSVEHTRIKRTPQGGWLYWTEHPRPKSNEWQQGVLSDVRLIADRVRSDVRKD